MRAQDGRCDHPLHCRQATCLLALLGLSPPQNTNLTHLPPIHRFRHRIGTVLPVGLSSSSCRDPCPCRHSRSCSSFRGDLRTTWSTTRRDLHWRRAVTHGSKGFLLARTTGRQVPSLAAPETLASVRLALARLGCGARCEGILGPALVCAMASPPAIRAHQTCHTSCKTTQHHPCRSPCSCPSCLCLSCLCPVTNSVHLHRDLTLEETGQDAARLSYPHLQRVDATPLTQGHLTERCLHKFRNMVHVCRHPHSVDLSPLAPEYDDVKRLLPALSFANHGSLKHTSSRTTVPSLAPDDPAYSACTGLRASASAPVK